MSLKWIIVLVLCAPACDYPSTGQTGLLSNVQEYAPVSLSMHPTNGQQYILGTSFGLLVTTDGQNFDWMCPETLGYANNFEPKVLIAPTGIYVTSFAGINISTDKGCSWQWSTGAVSGLWAEAIDVDSAGVIYAATGDGSQANFVAKSTDGIDFQSIAEPDAEAFWQSMKISETDDSVIYLSGYVPLDMPSPAGAAIAPVFYKSTNSGVDWTAVALGDFAFGKLPGLVVEYVSGDTVFVRSTRENMLAGDVIYRSTDGGSSFAKVHESLVPITGFLVDGSRVIAGTRNKGVFVSEDGGDSFSPATESPNMGCLAKEVDGTYLGCGSNWAPDNYALGRSSDADTWTGLMTFDDIRGQLACAAPSSSCDVTWETIQGALNPQPDVATEEPTSGGGCQTSRVGLASWLVLIMTGIALVRRRGSLHI